MNQLNLFDRPATADTIPAAPPVDTRRQARERILPVAGKQARRVLDFLRTRGKQGATDREISDELRMFSDSARARRNELMNLGAIVDSGRRRPTPSGRWARVWTDANISPEIIDPPTSEGHEPRDETNEDDFPF